MNASHRQDASQGQGEVKKQIKHGVQADAQTGSAELARLGRRIRRTACLTTYLSTPPLAGLTYNFDEILIFHKE